MRRCLARERKKAWAADGAGEWRPASGNAAFQRTLAVFGAMAENICIREATSLRSYDASVAFRASFKRVVGDVLKWTFAYAQYEIALHIRKAQMEHVISGFIL